MSQVGDRRPIAARGLRPVVAVADWLVRRRASPNAISVAGTVCALAAGLAFAGTVRLPQHAWMLWLAGALLVQLRLQANLLDGMVAIGRGVASSVGELFNEVPDRVSDTAILLGLGVAADSWAMGLAAALAAMSTAYIRAVGKAAGAPSEFCGPMAKQQRMAYVTGLAVFACVLPDAQRPALWYWALVMITLMSVATAIRRLLRIGRALRGVPG